jgi:hypothetical protein
MGLHLCRYPCWHRALILFGTVGYCWGLVALAMVLSPRYPSSEALLWGLAVWVVSTCLVKHLLQWRCQGREPSDGRWYRAAGWFALSAILFGHAERD